MPKGIPGRAVCSVEFCQTIVHGDGLCAAHYKRQRSGTAAPWADTPSGRVTKCITEGCGADVLSGHGRGRFCPSCIKQKAAAKAATLYARDPDKFLRRSRESRERKAQDPVWLEQRRKAGRERRMKQDYGMSLSEYERRVQEQAGLCAICLGPPTGAGGGDPVLHVDHCHQTGKVRALLCGRCNTMLGLAAESPARLRDAAAYLERHSPKELPDADQIVRSSRGEVNTD